jgi:hypothetical protein
MEYIKMMFGGVAVWPRYCGYEDMCHLARYAAKRVKKNPMMKKFVEQVYKVVDKFHFGNHTGDFPAFQPVDQLSLLCLITLLCTIHLGP